MAGMEGKEADSGGWRPGSRVLTEGVSIEYAINYGSGGLHASNWALERLWHVGLSGMHHPDIGIVPHCRSMASRSQGPYGTQRRLTMPTAYSVRASSLGESRDVRGVPARAVDPHDGRSRSANTRASVRFQQHGQWAIQQEDVSSSEDAPLFQF